MWIKSLQEMAARSKDFIGKGLSVGFVPTMGALHQGHISLVERSKAENDVTVVSVFVNPTQFGPSEDFEKYPRDLEGDIEKLRSIGVDVVFAPDVNDLYPDNYHSYVIVEDLSSKLCGRFRPVHFKGVATIVVKLFNIVRPARAYFGRKDYQQALIIRTMAKDLNMDIEIVVCPIIREEDGLAMSSRNLYMTGDERRAATVIYRALKEISDNLSKGDLSVEDTSAEFRRILSSEPLVNEIQYASAYDPVTLEELNNENIKGTILLAVALKIGKTRLIDNMIVKV